ncbi:hypothetical protein AURDEDRAFT_143041 [Auricularia subglabra TFB-10046 SS5]|nr:hypothetical protein AURDEDRAFT_143041 [Auricularia subglabra TFB-10046 SS5]
MFSANALPTRRELTILLVALVLFLLYFNATAYDSAPAQSLGSSRFQGIREKLSGLVLGPTGPDYSREFGSQFAKSIQAALNKWHLHSQLELPDQGSARQGRMDWAEQLPQTSIMTHVPGWTILDNVLVYKGSMYFVTDDPAAFPPMEAVSDWWQIHFINSTEASREFGSFGGRVTGISWFSTDEAKDVGRFTLLGLQRLHAAVSALPPARLVMPRISGPRPPPSLDSSLLHYAFSALSVWLKPEWDDFGDIIKPWLYERVVLASMGAAAHVWGDAVSWAPPFFVPAPDNWWSAIRTRIHDGIGLPSSSVPVVTYMTQGRAGLRLGGATREALVHGLEKLAQATGAELHILDPTDTRTRSFKNRAELIARSRILIGSPSAALDDAVFLRPGATLMEFFPPGVMLHDHGLPARMMGVEYIAWWGDKSFSASDIPHAKDTMPFTNNATLGENVPLAVDAVLDAISSRISGDL